VTAVSIEGPSSGEIMTSAKKRIAIGTGVGHLMWLILLVLMFANRLFGI
jgi:hypothetical protein